MRTKKSPSCDRPPRGRVAVTVAAAATMRKVMASPASPFAISEASGIGIPKAAAPLPVGWRGACGGMQGEMQGKYYRYCSRSIRYSTDLNSENNKFDLETFDLVSEYCNAMHISQYEYR